MLETSKKKPYLVLFKLKLHLKISIQRENTKCICFSFLLQHANIKINKLKSHLSVSGGFKKLQKTE